MEHIKKLYFADKAGFIQLAGLLLLAISLPFSVTFVQAGLFLAIGGGMCRLKREGLIKNLPSAAFGNPLFWPWMIYLAAAILAALAGLYPLRSFAAFNSDFLRYLAFASLCLFLTKENEEKVLPAYLFAIAAAALIGITQSATGLIHGFDIRAHAFAHQVRFGEIMVIGLTCALSLLFSGKALAKRTEFFALSCVLLSLAALILSQTRGAYLGLAAAILAMFAFSKEIRKQLLIFLVIALVMGAAFALLNPTLSYKVLSIGKGISSAVNTNQKAPDTSINTRLELWKIGFRIIKDRPFFGVGASNVKRVFHDYHPGPLAGQDSWGSLHNLYINQAAERGLVGLAALFLLFSAMFRTAYKNFASNGGPMSLWALAVLPAYFVMNLTEITFQHVHTSYAIFLALAVSMNSAKRKLESPEFPVEAGF